MRIQSVRKAVFYFEKLHPDVFVTISTVSSFFPHVASLTKKVSNSCHVNYVVFFFTLKKNGVRVLRLNHVVERFPRG